MSVNLLDQEEIILKHNFIVKISLDPNDSLCVMVDFAGKKRAYYRVVVDEEDNIYGIAYWSDLMNDEEEYIPLKATSIHLYILCDIYRQCREMEFPYEIVKFYDNENNLVEFMNLLQLKLEEYELNIMKILEKCIKKVLEEEVPIKLLTELLEKERILHEFNILSGLLI